MSETILVALISSSSTMLVAITALLLNYRGFNSLERRMDRFESRLDHIEDTLVGYCLDVARIKERLDIK